MKKMIILAVVMSFVSLPAFAASPWTQAANVNEQITGKLDFGVKNLLGGWFELIHEPYKVAKQDGNLLYGVAKGVTDALAATIGGAAHTVTFFIPQIDIPLPENGVDF